MIETAEQTAARLELEAETARIGRARLVRFEVRTDVECLRGPQ